MCGRIKAADAHRQDAAPESRMDMAERSEAWIQQQQPYDVAAVVDFDKVLER